MNPETTTLPLVTSLEEVAARFPAAEHAHATARAVAILTTAMNDGVLLPGEQLSEVRCADILGVSRNTLRQAFALLTASHLIEQIPNRGAFVVTPNTDQISEMFTVRRALQQTAISLIEPGAYPELHRVLERARSAQKQGSVSRMALENQNFHRELVALAGSQRLDELMASVLAEMRLLFHSMVTQPDFHGDFVEENGELLSLIEAGKRAEAQAFLDTYLRRSQAFFERHLI